MLLLLLKLLLLLALSLRIISIRADAAAARPFLQQRARPRACSLLTADFDVNRRARRHVSSEGGPSSQERQGLSGGRCDQVLTDFSKASVHPCRECRATWNSLAGPPRRHTGASPLARVTFCSPAAEFRKMATSEIPDEPYDNPRTRKPRDPPGTLCSPLRSPPSPKMNRPARDMSVFLFRGGMQLQA